MAYKGYGCGCCGTHYPTPGLPTAKHIKNKTSDLQIRILVLDT